MEQEAAHYQTWRNTVANKMAEPRSSVKYDNVFPGDEGRGQLRPSRSDLDADGDRFCCGGSA
jgi:hypothetical protein